MRLTRRNASSFDPFRDFVDAVARDAGVAVASRDCCSTDSSASCCGGGAKTAAAAEVGFPMDISEAGGTFIVRGNVPGFRKEEIRVHVRNGVLTIEARRAENVDQPSPAATAPAPSVSEPTERFYRRERFDGAVVRRLRLPQRFADTEPTAELRDGVLTLKFPESPAARERQVPIR